MDKVKLYIGFQGGTYGNFLRYFLDKFCSLTPAIDDLPFNEIGTSHKRLNYSTKFDRYHPTVEGFKDTSIPHCIITVSADDLLLLQRAVYIRPGNIDTDTDNDYIQFSKEYFKEFGDTESINQLYKIKINENTLVPNYILRDFIKLGFSDVKNHGYLIGNKMLMNNNLKNVHYLPVSSFWNREEFFKQIQTLNTKFNLSLSLNENIIFVHNEFIKNIKQFPTKNRCKNIIEHLKNKKPLEIENIDIVEQAYIYSWIETTHQNILAPFTSSFFKNTNDILNYIKWYPHFYHGMNPTLPKKLH